MGVAASSQDTLWGCPVPFAIDSSLPDASRITNAVAQLEQYTRWRFVSRTTEVDYVEFVPDATCSSFIGRQGGRQVINLASECGVGTVIHEIMHALGVPHEQSRSDRDNFVEVVLDNVDPALHNNFDIFNGQVLIGDYDVNSIMHYSLTAFSLNGEPTIRVRDGVVPANTCASIGQRSGITETDVLSIMSRFTGSPTCGTDLSPPPFVECPADSMRLCGYTGPNELINGIYFPFGTSAGRRAFRKQSGDAFLYWLESQSEWAVSSNLGSTFVAALGGPDVLAPDLVTSWRVADEDVFVTAPTLMAQPCGEQTPTEPPNPNEAQCRDFTAPNFEPNGQCCEPADPCDVGQGSCESDSACADGLLCGERGSCIDSWGDDAPVLFRCCFPDPNATPFPTDRVVTENLVDIGGVEVSMTVVGAAVGGFLLLLCCFVGGCCYRRYKNDQTEMDMYAADPSGGHMPMSAINAEVSHVRQPSVIQYSPPSRATLGRGQQPRRAPTQDVVELSASESSCHGQRTSECNTLSDAGDFNHHNPRSLTSHRYNGGRPPWV